MRTDVDLFETLFTPGEVSWEELRLMFLRPQWSDLGTGTLTAHLEIETDE